MSKDLIITKKPGQEFGLYKGLLQYRVTTDKNSSIYEGYDGFRVIFAMSPKEFITKADKYLAGKYTKEQLQSKEMFKRYKKDKMRGKAMKNVVDFVFESSLEGKQIEELDIEKEAVAPKGWEGTVKKLKKHKEIDNPWALAWDMKNKGYTPHK